MDFRDMIYALVESAGRDSENLHGLVEDSRDDDNQEAHQTYQAHLDKTNSAIEAARKWLGDPENGKTVRVVVDFTGGLFQGAHSNVPLEVIAVDSDDKEHVRASVPGFGDNIWAELQDAEVDPGNVNAAFDGVEWLGDSECSECGATVAEVHGCPDGRELCDECFQSGD